MIFYSRPPYSPQPPKDDTPMTEQQREEQRKALIIIAIVGVPLFIILGLFIVYCLKS